MNGREKRGPRARRAGKRLASAKGRTPSSARWLTRQLRDPYVAEARRLGLRSRAAFKLCELDEKFRFLKRGARVVDLGAAPGGWTQVAVERVGAAVGLGRVVAVDKEAMAPLAGATVLRLDLCRDEEAPERVREALVGRADVVLSDMAPAATGHAATDHLRTMVLAEAALDLAERVLGPGGTFVVKILKGGTEAELLARLKRRFAAVRQAKPPASRKESAETYVVARGYREEGRE